MDTVRLKARPGIGPTGVKLRHRLPDGRYEVREYNWTLDNSCTVSMPVDDWEALKHEHFDRRTGLKYHEAFKEL